MNFYVITLIKVAIVMFVFMTTLAYLQWIERKVLAYIQLTDLPIGILMILGLSSIGVYGVALAGWASNSKYALLGGLRSAAQMISYELPMALALAAPLLMINTLSLREMVGMQEGFLFGVLPRWTVFQGPFPQ